MIDQAVGRVRESLKDRVLTLTLADAATGNAQDPAVWSRLAEIGARIDDDVRVVLLRAEGPIFSSGLNLKYADPANPAGVGGLLRLDDSGLLAEIESFQSAFRWWREVPAVTIAVVTGAAVGAGFQLALATDLRVATTSARFAMREVSLGLVPDMGGTGVLLELVGYPRALELCATGRWLPADEARQWGILDRLVTAEDLESTLAELVGAFLAPDAGVVAATKRLLRGGVGLGRQEQLRAERLAQVARLRELGRVRSGSGVGHL